MYKKIDKENMHNAIWSFADNLLEALKLGENLSFSQDYGEIQNIIISGMGGSAIGGDVLNIIEENSLKVPCLVLRKYELPNWVNSKTLVICSSYSGNTEETLSSFNNAMQRGAKVIGITTGGKLKDRMKNLKKDVVTIPSGLQPRAALAYSFVPMIKVLQKLDLVVSNIDKWLPESVISLKEKRNLYSKDSDNNPTFELAKKIRNKIPIIYSDSSTLQVAAVRLKGQICENSKMLCYHNELPELNHNEIVGWENYHQSYKNLFLIWLLDSSDNSRVKIRYDITRNILNEKSIKQHVIRMEENTFENRFLNMIHYGDWLSFWCAILNNTDPSPVKNIIKLKNQLDIL